MSIKVIAAVYGTMTKGNDVTATVQQMVAQGNDDIPINNDTLGPDPDHGVQKQFGILYTLPNGKRLARAAVEGQTLDLVTQ